MQKANSANEYTIRRHRLIEQQEIIRFQDHHCPVSILTEEPPLLAHQRCTGFAGKRRPDIPLNHSHCSLR